MLSYEYIKRCVGQTGFSVCGIARARILEEHTGRFEAGLAASGDEVLGYLAARPERRFDPSTIVAGARTIVVCALAYPRIEYPADFEGPKRASFAHLDEDYHTKIKSMLREVLERLREPVPGASGAGPGLKGKVCCDTSAILEKAWAVEAGLGWQGRNSLLISPLWGSFLLLGELVLDAECDRYDEPYDGPGCGSCRACERACPTGALKNRTVDTGRCIAALTVEKSRRGETVEPLYGWAYGCDECQIACPANRKK